MASIPTVLLASALLVSCSSKKEEKQSAETRQETSAAEVAPETGADQQEEPAPATASESSSEVPGVAPLTSKMVEADRNPAAKPLNAEGLKAHRLGNYSEAIGHFKKALATDPGALLARYNLACSLVRSGANSQALALLEQFQKVACTGCRERLDRAREDEDWETLWNDSRFREIVALPEEGHQVGSAYLELRFPEELKKPVFTLRPRMVLDRLPGDATLVPFELVLSDADREIARAPMDLAKRKGPQVVGAIGIPGVGRYVLDLVSGGRVYESSVFEIRELLILGGRKGYEVNRVGLVLVGEADDSEDGWVPTVGEEEFAAAIEWSFPLAGDADYSYLQVWRHNGRMYEVDTLEVEGVRLNLDEQIVIGRSPLSIEIPSEPGKWMLGLYSDSGKSFEIRYDLTNGADAAEIRPRLKILDKAPAWTKQHHDEAGYEDFSRDEIWNGEGEPDSTRLIRAATRSAKVLASFEAYEQGRSPEAAQSLLALAAKHGAPWKASEQPSSNAWPSETVTTVYANPPEGTCTRARCSEYPAISPDGKFLATFQPEEIKFWDEEDECWRPEGSFYRYWDVASGKEVASKNLSQFKPMRCSGGDINLEAGFKLAMKDLGDGTQVMTIKDKDGKTVEKIEEYSSSFDHCTLPGIRVVVTETSDGASHCHETSTNWYGMTRY